MATRNGLYPERQESSNLANMGEIRQEGIALQKENEGPTPVQPELSEVWQELLGGSLPTTAGVPVAPKEAVIPTIESDPWGELVHAQGVEVVDLQKVQLHMSDQDVEQMLQVMQEQAAQKPQGNGAATNTNSTATDHQ